VKSTGAIATVAFLRGLGKHVQIRFLLRRLAPLRNPREADYLSPERRSVIPQPVASQP